MQLVQKTVNHRCKGNRGSHDQDHAAEQRVKALKKLAVNRGRRIKHAHARHDHRGVDKGIKPGDALQIVVPRHTGQ